MRQAESFSLSGSVALVIGGTGGIGREICLGYHEAGATVLPVSRTAANVESLAREIRSRGGRSHGYAVDVTDAGAIRGLVRQVIAEHERVDILVNCQGAIVLKPADECTEAEFDTVINTNLRSVFFATVEVGRHMLARRQGVVISIASLAAFRGWSLASLYGMSKFGVVSMTETLAVEWAPRGVRVNAIAPGFFLTELNRDKMSAQRKESAVARTPLGRFGETRELVGAAVYLASPAASFVTGATLRVDGGYLAQGI